MDDEPGTPPTDRGVTGRQAVAAAGRGVARGSRAVAHLTAVAGRGTVRVARRASEAQGAGETGLARLIQVHAFSMAGDTAVMVGLAGTLFLQPSAAEARTDVLMFLLLTMLPFAVVAPLLGPLLDRFRHGRRWSIGATLATRAFLCWVLASSIDAESTWQFPAALGVLVASKAYLVTRSSATPRLLPQQLTLVKANGRLSLAGTVGAGLGGGAAGLAASFGSAWALRVAFAFFVVGTVLAILLSPRVDSSQGESQAAIRDLVDESEGGQRRGISGELVTALRANAGLRWLSGFLTIYLVFLFRIHPLPGWSSTTLLALVVGAAGVGNAIGTMTGALVRTAPPKLTVLATLLLDAVVAVVAAVQFTVVTAVAVGLVAGIGQQMGKLALDALIQDTVPEAVRTSVFGRSETLVQLSWVIGGLVGVVLPLDSRVGMTTAAVLLVVWSVLVLVWDAGHSVPLPARARGRASGRRGGSTRHDPDRMTEDREHEPSVRERSVHETGPGATQPVPRRRADPTRPMPQPRTGPEGSTRPVPSDRGRPRDAEWVDAEWIDYEPRYGAEQRAYREQQHGPVEPLTQDDHESRTEPLRRSRVRGLGRTASDPDQQDSHVEDSRRDRWTSRFRDD